MGTLVIDNGDKIGKEELLLGDVSIQTVDCNGNQVTLTGLLGNDFIFKLANGDTLPLASFIETYSNSMMDLTNTVIENSKGEIVKMVDIVRGLEDVEFRVIDLQAQYNTLKG